MLALALVVSLLAVPIMMLMPLVLDPAHVVPAAVCAEQLQLNRVHLVGGGTPPL